MVRGLERFAAALCACAARKHVFVNLQIVLKVERGSRVPLFFMSQCDQKFLPKERSLFTREWRGLFCGGWPVVDASDQADRSGEKRLTLKKREQVAIKWRVDLKSVAAVFHHIGIHKALNYPLLC